jgi:predicted molibdopterin-dependent oxidoreductase YjgC
MGGLVNVLPGYQSVESDEARERYGKAWGAELSPVIGKTLTEMIDAANSGEMKAMYIMGENPMLSDPDINHVRSGLEALDFLVVQDIFLTETAQLADVVLPGVTFAEKDGTFTNTERRVQRVRKAVEPEGDARPDWMIVRDVANMMGAGWSYDSPKEIMEEVNSLVPQYGGASYDRLEECGLQWPCPDDDHPGTKILHMDNFIHGKGKMADISYRGAEELPDESFPFVFNTGRHLMHFHSGSMSRRSRSLDILDPEPLVDIHPADARDLGISERDMITVTSRRGELTARALVTTRTARGNIFLPFHYVEAAANLLTNSARDPVCKIPELKVCAVKVEKSS